MQAVSRHPIVKHRVRRRLSTKEKRAICYVIGLGSVASVLCALLLWRLNRPSPPSHEVPIPRLGLGQYDR